MKQNLKTYAKSILLLLFGISVWFNYTSIRDGIAMNRLLTKQGALLLTPDITKMLLEDLKSADKTRLQQWHSYLYVTAGYDTNANVVSAGLEDTFAQYKSKEKPGRSNYFHRLVSDLRMKQGSKPLSKQDLLRFLGPPDGTLKEPDGQVLYHKYRFAGRDYFSWAVVSNGMVVRINLVME